MTTQNKNVPALRFPEFNEDWKETNLSKIGEIIAGGTPDTLKSELWGGNIYWFTPTEIKSKYIDKSIRTITEKGLKKSSAKLLPKGTLLFSSRATVGDVGIAINECCTNQGFQSIVVNESNANEFIYYWMVQNKNEFVKKASGSTFLEINKTEISKLKIILPTLPEQQKIAAFLTAVDEKIQQLTKKKDLLEQYKKGVMQKIFNQEIRFKDDNGNDFAGWEEQRLGDFLIKYDKKTTENNQYPVLTSSHKGIFLQSDYFSGNQIASEDNTGYNLVPRGYFTYRHMSDTTIFKFNINNIVDFGMVSTLYPVFTTKNLNSDFLRIKLNNGKEFANYAIMQKQGGSRTYMYFSKLQELVLDLPSVNEQSKIVNFLSAIDDKINLVNKQLEKTKEYKKGLLQQMFI